MGWSGVRCGGVRCGGVRCGGVRCGGVRCGGARCGRVRCFLGSMCELEWCVFIVVSHVSRRCTVFYCVYICRWRHLVP